VVYIKREWADDYIVERCKCDNCHNVWLDDDNSNLLCPGCGSDDWDGDDLTVQEIKEIEQSEDGTLCYEII